MTDMVLVVLLLAFIWAAILIPPAASARAAREAEFLGSIRPGDHPLAGNDESASADQVRFRPALTPNARRRQVLGGLVVAMGATLIVGLLPTFRLLLVVHLLLLNSCLAYIGALVYLRDQEAARTRDRSEAPAWRRDRETRRETTFAEAVHPYAALDGSDDGELVWDDEPAYVGSMAYADGAYASDGYADDGYADDAYASDGWDVEAEAAYVDGELGLARPA